jgi:hypothetical protein
MNLILRSRLPTCPRFVIAQVPKPNRTCAIRGDRPSGRVLGSIKQESSKKTMPSTKLIRNLELAGIAVIFIAGTAWHFLFEWSGFWQPIAWLAPVNESTWEHFKMAFWPGLIWACVEYWTAGKTEQNYWLGKFCGLLCMPVIIAVVFYSYTTVLGMRYLWVDILSFLMAITVGQLVSYRIILAAKVRVPAQWLGVVGIMGMILAFVLFTYAPPHIFLFENVATHAYGILNHY